MIESSLDDMPLPPPPPLPSLLDATTVPMVLCTSPTFCFRRENMLTPPLPWLAVTVVAVVAVVAILVEVVVDALVVA